MNQIYRMIANGKNVGITIASTHEVALRQAKRALTRNTASKDDLDSDYAAIEVKLLTQPARQIKSTFVAKLMARLQEVSQARFIAEETGS